MVAFYNNHGVLPLENHSTICEAAKREKHMAVALTPQNVKRAIL
jgi:hypothetical protein